MRRLLGIGLVTLGLLFATGAPVRAELLSKKYHFKSDVVLQIGVDASGVKEPDGFKRIMLGRLDTGFHVVRGYLDAVEVINKGEDTGKSP